MDTENQVTAFIGSLYEASAVPEQWSDTLAQFTRLTDARFGHFVLWDEAANRCVRSVIGGTPGAIPDPASVEAYDAYYGVIDPRRGLVSRTRPGQVVSCASLISEETVAKNEFYQDFLIPADVRWAMMVGFPVADGVHATFATLRSPRSEAFEPDVSRRVQKLIPHFQRSTLIARKLAQTSMGRDLAAAAWDRNAMAMMVTDERGRVRFVNAKARELLQGQNGIRLKGGTLSAVDARCHRALINAIEAAVPARVPRPRTAANLMISRAQGRPLALTITPLPATAMANHERPGALLLIADPEAARPSLSRQMAQLFGLTPAEARLASDLWEGASVEAIAERRNVKVSTMRTHLAHVLMKTGTERQADLLRLMGVLPSVREDDRLET